MTTTLSDLARAGSSQDLDPGEVLVGIASGPGIWIAEVGTPAPAGIDAPWTGFESMGYASEDGVTLSQATDSESITPWQSVTPIRTMITNRSVTCGMQLLQWNARTLSLYFDTEEPTEGDDGSLSFDVRTDKGGFLYTLGVDILDGSEALRLIFPRVQLESAGDMQFTRGAAAILDVTFSALADNGKLVTIMRGKPGSGGGGGNALAVAATPGAGGTVQATATPADAPADTAPAPAPAPEAATTPATDAAAPTAGGSGA